MALEYHAARCSVSISLGIGVYFGPSMQAEVEWIALDSVPPDIKNRRQGSANVPAFPRHHG